ncbi:hypothetical protein GJ631_03390 [Natronomonas sp. CBA1123]|nr:hypothetical protein [Natronomonas sp. CBA1123]
MTTRHMSYETIAVDRHPEDDRIARIRFDRADRNNVLDSRVLDELTVAITDADRDDDVRGILLGSTEPPFCSGASLAELTELQWEEGARWMTAYFETLDLLRDTGKPVVAAAEGTCVAGGNELASACDLIVAGESTRFGQPEVGVGSTAAGGGVQLLPLMIGEKTRPGPAVDGATAGGRGGEIYRPHQPRRRRRRRRGEGRGDSHDHRRREESTGLPNHQGRHETVDEPRVDRPGDGPRPHRPSVGLPGVPGARRGVPRTRRTETATVPRDAAA